MEPTLHCAVPAVGCKAGASDRVLANRFIYRFRDPERGDIVVFETPDDAVRECGAGGTFVKRLIGLPGDTIGQQSGILRVNGAPLEEPYLNGSAAGQDFARRTLGSDEYFMMGDNRAESCDSRRWGPVSRHDLIGPVFAVYWPPTRLGLR
jgi:signal peptidase I